MATIQRGMDNGHWTVKMPGRVVSGFSSLEWAVRFCETMGWVVWDDPDV